MGTKTGELRETLLSAIEDVRSGKIDAAKATAISKLAAQVSVSLNAELAARELTKQAGKLGSLNLGDETE